MISTAVSAKESEGGGICAKNRSVFVIIARDYPFGDFLMLGSFSLWIYDANVSLKEKNLLHKYSLHFLPKIIPVSGPV